MSPDGRDAAGVRINLQGEDQVVGALPLTGKTDGDGVSMTVTSR